MDWLDEDTWFDADATWVAPSAIPVVMAIMGFEMPLAISRPKTRPIRVAVTEMIIIV
jgi:hypothetical protein